MGCMLFGSAKQGKKSGYLTYPLLAARRFVRAFSGFQRPTQKQQVLLAAAHCTLAGEQNLSLSRSTMHLNAAISLLKKVPAAYQSPKWQLQLAQAHFKRAEALEEKQAFAQSLKDYQQSISLLEPLKAILDDEQHLMLARAALCIADLIHHDCIDSKNLSLEHPLSYVNHALGALEAIRKPSDEAFMSYAHAHQIAGMQLSAQDFRAAFEALQRALEIALKTQSTQTAFVLSDIYSCLGLLYEKHHCSSSLLHTADPRADYAVIYFGLSLLFGPEDYDEDPEDPFALDCLFELIDCVLDPYPKLLPHALTLQLVDALIQAYICVLQQRLPNQALLEPLTEPEALDSFARHIYWLILAMHAKYHSNQNWIPTLIAPYKPTLSIAQSISYTPEALEMLCAFPDNPSCDDSTLPNNVYYLCF